ncbi:unnamed protein product, partial [Phaeothamnion confervicola]
LPLVINTWSGPFVTATEAAWARGRSHDAYSAALLGNSGTATTLLDAVEAGCSACEAARCDGTVGYGGRPDSSGEVTLDAMIMDGAAMRIGAVGYLRRVKNAISVARAVMEHTEHTMLAGEGATNFATATMGFAEHTLSTADSDAAFVQWRAASCQPNYFRNFASADSSCPPYDAPTTAPGAPALRDDSARDEIGEGNHDTVGMVVVGSGGNIACGTSTNGA